MIAFDCEKCGKPLMVPDAKSGQSHSCPACSFRMVVPPPAERSVWSRIPYVKIVFLLLLVSFVGTGWSFVAYQGNRNNIIKQQFQAILHNYNPQWGGIEWLACDVRRHEFQVSAQFPGSMGNIYSCQAISLSDGAQTSIRINPGEEGALATAFISSGHMRSFDYNGQSQAEREQLQNLALDLDGALSTAVKQVQP